jgi:hypothetical protein
MAIQNAPFITLISVRFKQELEWYRTNGEKIALAHYRYSLPSASVETGL